MASKPELALWKCDHCGGPATWTFIDEHPHYHYERQCDGFMQVDFLDPHRYVDSVGSVSALAEAEGSPWLDDEELHNQYRRFLNGS